MLVDVLIFKISASEMRKDRYFTALDNCDQDVIDTLAIIRMFYQKSDNIGCYAGNSKEHHIILLRHECNESQCGQNQVDRNSLVKALKCILW